MKTYTIRKSVLNATADQWVIIKRKALGDTLCVSVDEFFKTVGLVNCLTAHQNDEEKEFFYKLFQLARTTRTTQIN